MATNEPENTDVVDTKVPAETEYQDDCVEAFSCSSAELEDISITFPLNVLVDGQDLTRHHICLSSPGIPTVLDGVVYIHTLVPVDVLAEKPIPLESTPWPAANGIPSVSSQGARTRGGLEFGIVASRISPSQWDFLAYSDCLVTAVALCEKKRSQLATAGAFQSERQSGCNTDLPSDEAAALSNNPQRGVENACGEEQASSGSLNPSSRDQGLTGKDSFIVVPDVDYLMETVVPVLYPALEVVARERPDDPLAAVAFYLLRNSSGYSSTAIDAERAGRA
ncbi:Dpy-30 motif containing protein, putative [Eimeria tenella]|uniref:Dpy-30 motif containing protein, putative n=1 Tax=Eimeria tenella TaxID=5802 RepID=U6KXB8_EIMTE|nr:Dpy-30 motif containing protein, putative [Eimeria tenella]CDJ40969.1 Dpy-30 motif containing protein, putative [Eimeria tenella]|eukprot:XP_013231719.1 Dpy-30 motif containing protein, putative [Eimeria tenella]